MLLLYRLLFPLVLLAALPVILARMLRRGGYARHFTQRLGMVSEPPPKRSGGRRIWIHAVSVGELIALGSLLDLLRREAGSEIVLTTTTSTGYALAERNYAPYLAYLGYFPVDFWPVSRHVWNRLQPDTCLLMEGEIWPEHLHQARLRRVPVVLINARLSELSFRRWRALPGWLRTHFAMLTMVVAASEEDGERFARLGVSREKITVSGNLKLDFSPGPELDPDGLAELRRELGLAASTSVAEGAVDVAPKASPRNTLDTVREHLVLAGASTWPGEEEMLLRVTQSLANQGLPCKLLLIPRHAERRTALRELLVKDGWKAHFRSFGSAVEPVEAAVADTTGEMALLLQVADVVFVGKSMDPHRGGQNPIEAAALGKPVLFGPNMQNFRAVVESMLAAEAAEVVQDEEELTRLVADLFRDQAARETLGRAARAWHRAGKGATRRTLEAISRLVFSD